MGFDVYIESEKKVSPDYFRASIFEMADLRDMMRVAGMLDEQRVEGLELWLHQMPSYVLSYRDLIEGQGRVRVGPRSTTLLLPVVELLEEGTFVDERGVPLTGDALEALRDRVAEDEWEPSAEEREAILAAAERPPDYPGPHPELACGILSWKLRSNYFWIFPCEIRTALAACEASGMEARAAARGALLAPASEFGRPPYLRNGMEMSHMPPVSREDRERWVEGMTYMWRRWLDFLRLGARHNGITVH